ncbi:GNAT family N-acetyltransferase [Luteimonas marina]|uniref:GNAT family N-acetyltransferase n=1 Tax=Luteimonas marina TaxID=488485 RepID=A0A5C5TZU3_9GAMM|nr:GNAT family N-acetyltransferase [Luteimonas marina]TWT18660.1 GNAT family N-acetyltransferase [Luteimonas marina]
MSVGHFGPGAGLPDADLRSASLIDADDVATLLSELGYPCDLDDAARRIRAIGDNDRQALVVARVGGVVSGLVALDFMYYLPLDTTTCRITALVVTSSARGQGLGRQLLREAERRARTGGAARLELSSGSQRTDAHAFYKACGFSDGTVRFIKRLGDA